MRNSVLGILALLLVAAQFVPLDRTNPRVESDVAAPESVAWILRKACYDCHSHETRWPWYAYVAPVSFLVHHDVVEAREHMNFSRWGSYDAAQRNDLFEEIAEEVREREMPLQIYLSLHAEARLTNDERRILTDWADSQRSE